MLHRFNRLLVDPRQLLEDKPLAPLLKYLPLLVDADTRQLVRGDRVSIGLVLGSLALFKRPAIVKIIVKRGLRLACVGEVSRVLFEVYDLVHPGLAYRLWLVVVTAIDFLIVENGNRVALGDEVFRVVARGDNQGFWRRWRCGHCATNLQTPLSQIYLAHLHLGARL